MRNVLISTSNY